MDLNSNFSSEIKKKFEQTKEVIFANRLDVLNNFPLTLIGFLLIVSIFNNLTKKCPRKGGLFRFKDISISSLISPYTYKQNYMKKLAIRPLLGEHS